MCASGGAELGSDTSKPASSTDVSAPRENGSRSEMLGERCPRGLGLGYSLMRDARLLRRECSERSVSTLGAGAAEPLPLSALNERSAGRRRAARILFQGNGEVSGALDTLSARPTSGTSPASHEGGDGGGGDGYSASSGHAGGRERETASCAVERLAVCCALHRARHAAKWRVSVVTCCCTVLSNSGRRAPLACMQNTSMAVASHRHALGRR